MAALELEWNHLGEENEGLGNVDLTNGNLPVYKRRAKSGRRNGMYFDRILQKTRRLRNRGLNDRSKSNRISKAQAQQLWV